MNSTPRIVSICLVPVFVFGVVCPSMADDGYGLWLKYRRLDDSLMTGMYAGLLRPPLVTGNSETCGRIREELTRAFQMMAGDRRPDPSSERWSGIIVSTPEFSDQLRAAGYERIVAELGDGGYLVRAESFEGRSVVVVSARTDVGLLYGAFHLLRLLQTHRPLEGLNVVSTPRIRHRLLNHWDNLDRTVERGYAGRSLWNWDALPTTIDLRYTDYARANASIGINGAVLNNVNANPEILRPEQLRKIAALADVFRPYGIRVFLSVNFASPMDSKFDVEANRRGGIGVLSTADPHDPDVRRWWKDKADEIYRFIPDFGGFLVKANSEGMPGPRDYGRSHAEGANMLADALAPHGGIVMWRAFVYDASIDSDRTKRAYLEFVPLDGQFRPNVIIQAKNGPLDFQPREPVQPLFGALRKTPAMLELQITQEYLGHSTHLVYLAPMWKEALQFDLHADGPGSTTAALTDGSLRPNTHTAIAGVANIGDDRNWSGHFFAQANWYAYGRLAWDHTLSAGEIADDWIRISLTNDDRVVKSVHDMMMGSWEACISYMTPLGLHHIMQEGFHYGPQPQHNIGREDWTSVYYHRADSLGLGYDRSSKGSDAVSQYTEPLRSMFDNIETCPEPYLLWFHHVPWSRTLTSGRSLWEELIVRYATGVEYVRAMGDQWATLKPQIDPEIHAHVAAKLRTQLADAGVWKDTCLSYFQTYSALPMILPGKGR